jgi:hypothetical protein
LTKLKSGGNVMRKFGQRAVVTAAAVALTTAAFAGTALAGAHGNGGNGGSGGGANANCLIPVGVTAGVIGQGGPVSQCNAGGGAGGSGGDGVN